MTRVLVIEDVEDARNSIRRTLEINGYEVLTAPNGKRGLELIKETTPDVILTDIFMPEMEGLETIRNIIEGDNGIPIIVMTGSLGTPYLKAGLDFGAVSGLYKPFTPEQLLSAISDALAPGEPGVKLGLDARLKK